MICEIVRVWPQDTALLSQVDALLAQEGLSRDGNLDYTCALLDSSGRVVGTGGYFDNTLRCLAVSRKYQGQGLLNKLVTHLLDQEYACGKTHLFVYTKASAAPMLQDLGFYEITRVGETLVFLENRRKGFETYLHGLNSRKRPGCSAAVVMNANPFTLGHQYLVETAAKQCDTLHLFVVSEDRSQFPFFVRKRLLEEGVAHLSNVLIHETGPYLISSATFPSYFLGDSEAVSENHARLDDAVFGKVAHVLGITVRYVGEEPFSQVTRLYNQILTQELPKMGIACRVVPRLEVEGEPVSASRVRSLLQQGDLKQVRKLVPNSTFSFFTQYSL